MPARIAASVSTITHLVAGRLDTSALKKPCAASPFGTTFSEDKPAMKCKPSGGNRQIELIRSFNLRSLSSFAR